MAALPIKAILDTSVYLPFLRQNGEIQDLTFLHRPTLLYLSSVVFAELFAGARDRSTVRLLERFYRTFDRANRVIAPDQQVWLEAAHVLHRFGIRHGFEAIGLARFSHDILIALTARKIGAIVFTRNRTDFERIQEVRDFRLEIYE
ncbi:MAG TPA: type II toxin-antitoxin system VapC family toxin [Candidatus Acidoferrales bacterium]|nr:type II toxin-antitoxin system VapC family toxin [Candidatus Acidoferrales bacterium]